MPKVKATTARQTAIREPGAVTGPPLQRPGVGHRSIASGIGLMRGRISVMVSSRCRDNFDGRALTDVREALKQRLESERLAGEALFDVWISEPALGPNLTTNWFDNGLEQARAADIVVVLYNGCAGRPRAAGDLVGVCHAEFQSAWESARRKVRVIRLPDHREQQADTAEAHRRDTAFAEWYARLKVAETRAANRTELLEITEQLVREALLDVVRAGRVELRRSSFARGIAGTWNRLSYEERRNVMTGALRAAVGDPSPTDAPGYVDGSLGGVPLLLRCDAVPAAMSISAARELVGQPFLRDYQAAERLRRDLPGPVHVIACHRGITEAQAIRQLGFPDATIVPENFGVFVADENTQIQILLLRDCRDPSSINDRVSAAVAWLGEDGELERLAARARLRMQIVQAVAVGKQSRPVSKTRP